MRVNLLEYSLCKMSFARLLVILYPFNASTGFCKSDCFILPPLILEEVRNTDHPSHTKSKYQMPFLLSVELPHPRENYTEFFNERVNTPLAQAPIPNYTVCAARFVTKIGVFGTENMTGILVQDSFYFLVLRMSINPIFLNILGKEKVPLMRLKSYKFNKPLRLHYSVKN